MEVQRQWSFINEPLLQDKKKKKKMLNDVLKALAKLSREIN